MKAANESHESAAAARAAAALVVVQVLKNGRFLDAALEEARGRLRATDRAIAPLIQELAYGTLRWYHQLIGVANLFATRPFKAKDADIHALLLVGLYQLRHTRVADHAAVDATVSAADILKKSWAKGVLNACLRACLREAERVAQTIAASAELRYSHPAWLIDAISNDYPNAWPRILDANNERPPMTLRVNTTRVTRSDYLAALHAEGIAARTHSGVETALVLEMPVPVERLPGFAEGHASVQDAAAQLAAGFLETQPRQRVLDACAAPGGKAAHILERTPSLAELTALEVDPQRLERLRLNLRRVGVNARLMLADAMNRSSWWDGSAYDRILLDVPCSATGVIRRHPDIKVRRQPHDLPQLRRTQVQILDGVWPCLARGGKLLYVTCSVLNEENEQQMRDFLVRHTDAVAEPLQPGGNAIGYQILPGEDEMDGFYYARLRKR